MNSTLREKPQLQRSQELVGYHKQMEGYFFMMQARERKIRVGLEQQINVLQGGDRGPMQDLPELPEEPARPSRYHQMAGSDSLWQVQTDI
jgi:hypothetical protein